MNVVPAAGVLLESVLDSGHALARTGLTRRAYGQLDSAQGRTAWGRVHRRRLALVEGEAWLATATEYHLPGVLDRRPLLLWGIGDVFTHAERGHPRDAATLVDRMAEEGARAGAHVALLFSPGDSTWCEDHGFERMPTAEVAIEVARSPRHGAPMTLVRAGEERDLPAIVAMGRARADAFRFHLDRDVDLVQYAITTKRLRCGLGPKGSREMHFFVAEEGVAAVAYVVLSVAGGTWTIEECGDRDVPGARVGAILQALLARDPAGPRPAIRGWLPEGFVPPQVTIASTHPASEAPWVRGLGPSGERPRLTGRDLLYWHGDVW